MFGKTERLYMRGKRVSGVDSENIEILFDEKNRNYYADCRLIALGLGQTKEKALEDLREAAHFGIDTLINAKLDNRKH